MEPTSHQPYETDTHLFSENDALSLEDATPTQRFFNYLIDAIVMNFTIGIASGFVLGFVIAKISPDFAYDLFGAGRSGVYTFLASYLLAILNYLIYYSVCEKALKGKTVGKLATGTRAIRDDGTDLTWKDTFLRSLSRLVPFEAFSIWFGNGLWHDRWTNTRVIKSR